MKRIVLHPCTVVVDGKSMRFSGRYAYIGERVETDGPSRGPKPHELRQTREYIAARGAEAGARDAADGRPAIAVIPFVGGNWHDKNRDHLDAFVAAYEAAHAKRLKEAA